MAPTMMLLSNKTADAREAMGALIASRALSIREDDAAYPRELARLAWAIADAMAEEHTRRAAGTRRGGR